jgi:ubiquitin C-terminal hydrolase
VVHIGSGPYHGHYICIVRSFNQWLVFDDTHVHMINEDDMSQYFGDIPQSGSGYLLFYEMAQDDDKLATC